MGEATRESQATRESFCWGTVRGELVRQKEEGQFYMRDLTGNGNWVSFSEQHKFAGHGKTSGRLKPRQ